MLINKPTWIEKIIIYLSFILLFPIIWFIISRNNFIRLQQAIEETDSNINIQLKKRFDLLTQLFNITKKYINFEKNIFLDIAYLRNNNINKNNNFNNEKINFDEYFKKFNIILENYPNLKTNTIILQLQSNIQDCEDNIAASRRFYNANIKIFNSKINIFPSNVVASTFNLIPKKYYVILENNYKDIKFDF